MEQRVTALYFSPTHGTRAYVRAVAAAIPGEHREVDLTRPEERRKEYHFTENDLVILGVPVYYGRVPEVEGLLDGFHGGNTPVILLAVYGNRLIDDALVELSDLCAARGFRTLAAGSFVAPHTFSAKVGKGRPSETDLAAAAELGRRAADKLSGRGSPRRFRGTGPTGTSSGPPSIRRGTGAVPAAAPAPGPARWRPSTRPLPGRPTGRSASAAWPVSTPAQPAAAGWRGRPFPPPWPIWRMPSPRYSGPRSSFADKI